VAHNPDSGIKILVTDFALLAQDSLQLMRTILDFYGITAEPGWLKTRKPKPGRWKYRVGTSKDWRTEYTDTLFDRATELVPPAMRERFGWQ
jgi:hypothetical protein